MGMVGNLIVQAAIDMTGAAAGWLLRADGAGFTVVAAHGDGVEGAIGRVLVEGGSAALAIATGQAIALQRDGNEELFAVGAGQVLAQPIHGLVAVPAFDQGMPKGVLEIVNRTDGAPFGFDDIDSAAVLASVAGGWLGGQPASAGTGTLTSGTLTSGTGDSSDRSDPRGTGNVVSAAVLGDYLVDLERGHPQSYRRLARIIELVMTPE